MKQHIVAVKSARATIHVIFSDSQWADDFRDSEFLKRYVPAYEFAAVLGALDCVLRVKKSMRHHFSIAYPEALYSASRYNEKDIVSFAEYLLERARQEKEDYCMHSSSAVVRGQGIILWGGATGMGKTRIALTLGAESGNYFYSDEKTLVDLKKNIMKGGVAVAYLSKPYFKKVGLAKQFLSFDARHEQIPIQCLIYAHVEEASRGAIVERWTPEKFNWHLYEELARKIRGVSRRLFNNTISVPSLDTQQLADRRSQLVARYVQKTHCYFIKGNEKAMARAIHKLVLHRR